MRLPGYFILRTILPGMLAQWCLLALQACGSTESLTQVDVLGSYLYVDELNMAAGSSNQVHLACRRSNGRPLAAVAVQVEASKAGTAPSMLVQDWLVADGQGKQHISFSLHQAGMYTLALQLKLPGSGKAFRPEQAYTIVQVLDEQATGIANQAAQTQAQAGKPILAIARGTALNTQVLLLDNQQQQLQARKVRFQSSDSLAILPEPISLTAKEGGNKLILRGTKLYTLGEQTILAIEDETSRIVSEQRYQVTLGAKTVYRALLQKPQEPVVADGQTLAHVHLTLTDGSGEPMKRMSVALAIGQGSAIRSLSGRTDNAGMATFAWSETIAGNKPIELFLQVPSGMLPIKEDTILFVPGAPAQLRFSNGPAIAVAGEILQPAPVVQVVDALGNVVPMQDVPVTLTLAGGGGLGMSTLFAGETTVLLQEGTAAFPDVAILLAGSDIQLVAAAPGLLSALGPSLAVAPAAATQLAFAMQPAVGLAYGVSNPVRVAVQDAFGNLVPENGIPISLSVTGASNGHQLIGAVLVATRDGMANLDAVLDRSGSGFAVIASARDLLPVTSQTFDIGPGAPDGLFTQIIPISSPFVVADGVDTYTLEVRLRDGQNTPIVNFPVGVSSPLGQLQVASLPAAATDANGVMRIAIYSTLAGEKNVFIQMGNINRLVTPKPVFLPGAPGQAKVNVSQSTLIVDGLESLTVTGSLEDAYGNPLPNTPYTLSSTIPSDTITLSSGTTDSQGRLSALWQGTVAGARLLQIASGSGPLASVQAVFLPGRPSLLHSTLTVTAILPSPPLIADGQSTALLQARIADAFNNPIPAIDVLFSASGKGNLLPDALTYTDALGVAQASLRSFASQDKQIEIKLGPITLQATATFLPPPCIGTPVLSLGQGTENLITGSYPDDVVSADFNQDTIADLTVLNYWGHNLGVFLGRPDGTFEDQVTYGTGYVPSALTTLDANRDGLVDLAVVSRSSDTLGVFLGRPDGTFEDQVTYETGSGPSGIATLDANRDGLADLAVVNEWSDTLGLFLGRPDGTFADQVTYGTGSAPVGLTTLDANRDGLADLAVVNYWSETLGVFLGRPGGTFADQVTYGTGSQPVGRLTTLDANRDGLADLAVVNYQGDALGIYLGRADGTFADQVTYNTWGNGPRDSVILDANRDGLADLAVVNEYGGNLVIFLGQPDGTFAIQASYGMGSRPIALTTLDANRDGLVDLAVVHHGSDTIRILLGRPDGTFAPQDGYFGTSLGIGTGAGPSSAMITLDANRDGLADMAVVTHWTSTLGIFFGRPDGTFAPQVTYGTDSWPIALTSLDANRDGLADLAVVNYWSETLGVFLGRADGTFEDQVNYWTGGGSRPNALTSLDANLDGLDDLVVVSRSSDTLGVFLSRPEGTFADQVTYGTGDSPEALTTLDANRDGVVDLAVVNEWSDNLGIFLGRPDGTFAGQVIYGTASRPRDLTNLDANRDGVVDLVVVNSDSDTLGIFLGRLDGTFADQVTYETGDNPSALTTLDANRDGVADLGVVNEWSGTLSVFLGRADGTFAAQASYASARSPAGLRVLDMNQDGILDVFVYGAQSGLHLGAADGSFLPVLIYDQPGVDVVVGDFSRDYVPDLVISSSNGYELIERLYCEP